jgi:hypothetical protein
MSPGRGQIQGICQILTAMNPSSKGYELRCRRKIAEAKARWWRNTRKRTNRQFKHLVDDNRWFRKLLQELRRTGQPERLAW